MCFSDEAYFKADGSVNSQNVRRYAPRQGTRAQGTAQGRPDHFREKVPTFSQKVMVLLGVRGDGPLFGYTQYVWQSLNADRYHQLLVRTALPDLRQGNNGTLDGLTWQQDGAPPHVSDRNMGYLQCYGDDFFKTIFSSLLKPHFVLFVLLHRF